MTQNISVTKKSGELVPFDGEKLRQSLIRSGATEKMADTVLAQLIQVLHQGMSTQKVYRQAYTILSKLSDKSAGKYKLKNAIMELGPTGFPFEQYVGELLKVMGFEVQTGQVIAGKCVKHEVDVVGQNDHRIVMVECKFHKDGNTRSDVKIPMYIKSRFDDIYNQWMSEGRIGTRNYQGWLVTNTRFTEDAEAFGKCAGLHLMSWDYPHGTSLRELIDKAGLHPVTSLKSLTAKEKETIINHGIVLCRDITAEILKHANINLSKIPKILLEANNLAK